MKFVNLDARHSSESSLERFICPERERENSLKSGRRAYPSLVMTAVTDYIW